MPLDLRTLRWVELRWTPHHRVFVFSSYVCFYLFTSCNRDWTLTEQGRHNVLYWSKMDFSSCINTMHRTRVGFLATCCLVCAFWTTSLPTLIRGVSIARVKSVTLIPCRWQTFWAAVVTRRGQFTCFRKRFQICAVFIELGCSQLLTKNDAWRVLKTSHTRWVCAFIHFGSKLPSNTE